MQIHYFQHDHFEDLGYIGGWAANHKYSTSVTRFDLNPELPGHDTYDWLIVLGGKMGVNDSDEFPWIKAEIEYIKQAIQLGKTVIGICLGSQLVAKALGSKVYKNKEPEMGFWPVQFSSEASKDPVFKHFPTELTVMHMHFDIFDLPEGAISMASSTLTPSQAFRFGNNVFALQFHFEISESNAPVFIREITPEIVPGMYVQYPPEMLKSLRVCRRNNQIFSQMLESILASSR